MTENSNPHSEAPLRGDEGESMFFQTEISPQFVGYVQLVNLMFEMGEREKLEYVRDHVLPKTQFPGQCDHMLLNQHITRRLQGQPSQFDEFVLDDDEKAFFKLLQESELYMIQMWNMWFAIGNEMECHKQLQLQQKQKEEEERKKQKEEEEKRLEAKIRAQLEQEYQENLAKERQKWDQEHQEAVAKERKKWEQQRTLPPLSTIMEEDVDEDRRDFANDEELIKHANAVQATRSPFHDPDQDLLKNMAQEQHPDMLLASRFLGPKEPKEDYKQPEKADNERIMENKAKTKWDRTQLPKVSTRPGPVNRDLLNLNEYKFPLYEDLTPFQKSLFDNEQEYEQFTLKALIYPLIEVSQIYEKREKAKINLYHDESCCYGLNFLSGHTIYNEFTVEISDNREYTRYDRRRGWFVFSEILTDFYQRVGGKFYKQLIRVAEWKYFHYIINYSNVMMKQNEGNDEKVTAFAKIRQFYRELLVLNRIFDISQVHYYMLDNRRPKPGVINSIDKAHPWGRDLLFNEQSQ